MTDPKRLSEVGNDVEVELLQAGRSDSIPARSARTILLALGLAPAAAAAGTAASTTAVGMKLTLLKGVMAVAGVGATGALAIWAGQSLSTPATPPMDTPPSVVVEAPPAMIPNVTTQSQAEQSKAEVAPPPKQAIEDLELLEETEPVNEAATSKPKQRAVRSGGSAKDRLALELEAIDEARGALARGDHALASRLLDRYAARYPKPRLGAEALVLRIETQVAAGNRASAERLGSAFLKRNPNSPYARRVRSLIGDRTTTADP